MITHRERSSPEERQLTTSAGEIAYLLVRSPRRRTVEIRIGDGADVVVSAPRFLPEEKIRQFVDTKARWILEKLKDARTPGVQPARRRYEDGEEYFFLGQRYPLRVIPCSWRTGIHFDGTGWQAEIPPGLGAERSRAKVRGLVWGWYRRQAEEILGTRLLKEARRLGMAPEKIAVRTQKRIWGICYHSRRTINLNWKIVQAPEDVIDYVLVHELCHLKVPDHSRRFWNLVASFLPDYKARQRWLDEHTREMFLP